MFKSHGFTYGRKGFLGALAYIALDPEDDGGVSIGVVDEGGNTTDVTNEPMDTSEAAVQMDDNDPRVDVENEAETVTTLQATNTGVEVENEDPAAAGEQPQDQQQTQQQPEELRNMAARVDYLDQNLRQVSTQLQQSTQLLQQVQAENAQYRNFMQNLQTRAQTFQQQQQQPQAPQPPPPDAPFDVKMQYELDRTRFEATQQLTGVKQELAGLKQWFADGQKQAMVQAEKAQQEAARAQFTQEYEGQLGKVMGSADYAFLKDKGFYDPSSNQHVSRGQLYFRALYDAASTEMGRPADAVALANDLKEWFKEMGFQPPPAAKPGATQAQVKRTNQVVNARQQQAARTQNLKGVKPMGGSQRTGPSNGVDKARLRDKFLPPRDDTRTVN